MHPARTLLLVVLLGLLAVLNGSFPVEAEEVPDHPRKSLVRIDLEKSPSFKVEVMRDLDVATASGGRVEALVTPGELESLRQRGCAVSVLRPDVYEEFYAQRKNTARGAGNLSDYFNYAQMKADFQSIATDHPSIATYVVIGTTHEGNEIFGLKISDNPNVDEDEPEVLYCALHHSREPVSGECVRGFAHYLTDSYGSDSRVDAVVDGRELWLIPIVNPDGYIYVDTTDAFWRKNRRGGFGVDLNRNYGFEWGHDDLGSSSSTISSTYRGPAPFSEPEAQALRDLVDSREFVFSFDCHTYGDLYLPAYGYSPTTPQDLDVLLHHGGNMAATNQYEVASPPLTLYIANGVSIDYCYEPQPGRPRVLAISPEVGPWFYPSPAEVPSLVLENREPMLYLAEQAGDPYGPFPPNPSEVSAVNRTLSFANDHAHGRDLPESYEIEELSGLSRVTDDLESGTGSWVENGFSLSTARSRSGSRSYSSGSTPGVVVSLEAVAGLVVESGDDLTFWSWYDLEDEFDYAYVQVSTDGGVTYENLTGSISTTADGNGYNVGGGITGDSNGWVQATFSLADYVGQEVRVRFQVITDGGTTFEGFYVDDIAPVETFSSVTTVATGVTGSTFDVTGHTSGTFSYRVRGTDDDAQTSRYSNRVDVTFDEPLFILDFVPEFTQVEAGARLEFTATITNNDASPVTYDFWLDAELPNGSPWGNNPFVAPRAKTVPAMSTLERTAGFRIPGRMNPGGPFTLILRAGSFPGVSFEDSFQFEIVE